MKNPTPNENMIIDNVLEAIIEVSKAAEDSCLSEEKLLTVDLELQYLMEYLKTGVDEAIVFACIFILGQNIHEVQVRDISRYLNLNMADAVKLRLFFDNLLKNSLIVSVLPLRKKKRQTSIAGTSFVIPEDIIEGIYSNTALPLKKKKKPLDVYGFLTEACIVIQERVLDMRDKDEFTSGLRELESRNKLPFCSNLVKHLNILERAVLYNMADDVMRGYEATVMQKCLQEVIENPRDRMLMTKSILDGTSPLIQYDFIRQDGGRLVNDTFLILNEKTVQLFFQEDAELFVRRKNNNNLIKADSITAKKLFFDSKLEKEINTLQNLLTEENFMRLTSRLKVKNLPQNVIALLHGVPGTGKTEICRQIARETGRDIFRVDISRTKDKFFGESEKRIAGIFAEYRKLCKISAITPILLFNEADGILSKRTKVESGNTAQTQNAMQNILLEQLENFEGIFLATTNLIGNLDEAFERRFLFKIEFGKPGKESQRMIWLNSIDWLESQNLDKLCNHYDFSGAQIENIARKSTIDEVLNGILPSYEKIQEYCQAETGFKKTHSRVGF